MMQARRRETMTRSLGLGLVLLALAAPAARAQLVLYFLGGAGSPPSRAAQGYLGVDIRDISPDQVTALKLKDTRGAEVVLVDHDAPAGKAGLREHDVVLEMNGQAIDGQDQMRRMLHDSPPGRTIVLLVSRDGQQLTLTTTMSTREEVERQAWAQHLAVPEPQAPPADPADDGFSLGAAPSSAPPARGNSFIGSLLMNPSYTGAMLEKMSTQLAEFFGVANGAGLLVRSVQENSPAALAGMRAGDVVVRADARPVNSTSDWAKAIKNSHGHPLEIVVMRDKKEQTLTLTPDGKKRSSLQPLTTGPDQGEQADWRASTAKGLPVV